MNALTPDSLLTLPVDDLVTLPSETLCYLHHDATQQFAAAKTLVDHLEQVLTAKYAARANALRHVLGENTDIVQFDDDGVRITVHWPTTVEWDQAQLAAIARRLIASGEDPADTLDLTYHIPETRFNAWPDTLKTAFAKARNVRTASPDFRLSLVQGEKV